jgi:hypothetical protein
MSDLLDAAGLRTAYAELDEVARGGRFGPPPPGEWDREHILAHLVSADLAIASVALAVASGQRPTYDNRVNLDEWNLRRIIEQAGGHLADQVRAVGDLLCSIAGTLGLEELDTRVPVLIVSNDELIVDEPWTLRTLVEGVGRVHLPRHAEQLRELRDADDART